MPRAVILTALPVEYLAVRTYLTDLQEEMHPQGTIYERGKFITKGQAWEVGIAEVGTGNTGAAVEAERAIVYFKPDILFFVGIAGGIKDVKIGDVVAATKVYGYESGKVGEKFSTRPAAGQSAYAVIQRAKSEARKGEWIQRISGSSPSLPHVRVAPIAAGEKVVASTDSELFRFLRDSYNDAIAVEMEGFGFLSAAFAYPDIKAIVIRGISDLIEGKNDDSVEPEQVRQEKASHHASAFAFEILAKLPTNFSQNINSPQNIPYSEHVKFVGREKVIDTLHKQLKQTDRVAITGMGGVGKTELAIQYAWQYWEQTYPGGVCWLQARASDFGEQIRKFAELKMNLVVPEDLREGLSNRNQAAQSQAGAQVAEWFWQKWQPSKLALVIVDDVTDYRQVSRYLPHSGLHFKVLMTTRLQLDNLLKQISLEVLEEEPTVELLRRWIGGEQIDQQLVAARELSSRLGYLPLALNLVGRYVSKRGITLAKMLDRLEEAEELLRHRSLEVDTDDRTLVLELKGITAVFEVSWEELSSVAQELAYLLSLLPFTLYDWNLVEESISSLASIPWQLVEQDTEDLEDARVALEELHLLQRGGTYQLHPLIREFFRYKLKQYPGGDDVKRVIGMVDPNPNRAILPADFRILPTVNEFVGYPGCYVACYSRNEEGSQYSVGGGIYVMGQVRVPGSYERRICRPKDYGKADISAMSEFKERCAKNLQNVCQGDSCWAGGDTGGWFGLRE